MKKNNIFWISYSDLMTSLFFIMLVLFVVTIGYLKDIQRGLVKTIQEQEKLLKIEKQFKPLEESGNFYYLPACKKYIVKDLMGAEIFEPTQIKIKSEFITTTTNAGMAIRDFLIKLNKENPELSYLLVIEGNMANSFDKPMDKNNNWGYLTSYQRALAVYNLWLSKDIDFREFNVEVLICGSGFNGLCRDPIEENNKRFSIQIIPKVQNRIEH
jgi:hypothetical protein